MVRRLVATGSRATARTKQMVVVAKDSGTTIVKGERVRGGALLAMVPDVQTVPRGRLIATFEELLDRIGGEAQKGGSDR